MPASWKRLWTCLVRPIKSVAELIRLVRNTFEEFTLPLATLSRSSPPAHSKARRHVINLSLSCRAHADGGAGRCGWPGSGLAARYDAACEDGPRNSKDPHSVADLH